MSFILYILTILVYQDVVISAHVSAVIMELLIIKKQLKHLW